MYESEVSVTEWAVSSLSRLLSVAGEPIW